MRAFPPIGRDAAEAHAHDSRRHDSRLSHGVPGEREPTRTYRRRELFGILPREPTITRARKIREKIADRNGRVFVAGNARTFPRGANVVSLQARCGRSQILKMAGAELLGRQSHRATPLPLDVLLTIFTSVAIHSFHLRNFTRPKSRGTNK